ncbi:hypothetical protein Misp01_76440 [Microtetraspora sp. NBRC 13810]|uniref:hypothetical protein n=1 Tax=Microtetraspora sp. NBRC 13810 TaxID=3030990 RepID=UPI0024A2CF4D|nr:hypothetical protein [Microtetraspora sp. NBRC 13810]GLW12516.1 hypothetical protein Misp01_76440 [Microtetraspora sp. NBRC 13810]
MNPAIAARIPLVCRPKPPGFPLERRIAELTALTVETPGAGHSQRVARASGVLNFAALIASDSGMPDLAAELCWRQYKIFAEAEGLGQDIAVMSLMPLVNIARLLIREGDGTAAFTVLQQLYRAAEQRGATVIRDHDVDLSPLIRTVADHRKICTELWVTLLVDGARALASVGRWTEAAESMAAHRGVGQRLLDGRQITIMSLVEQDRPQKAAAMIDSSVPAEPWENAVAAILRIYCRPPASAASQDELDHAARKALTLIADPEPMTAAFRTRLGLTVLDLTADRPTPHDFTLRSAVIGVACSDAYAARNVLGHHGMRSRMTPQQEQEVAGVLTASGFGAGHLPATHLDALTAAISQGEDSLRTLLGTPALQSDPA